MHEMGITRDIIAIVDEKAGSKKVRRVKLQIGKLSAVMPDAIRFCFDVCAEGTALEGAQLEIEEIDGRAICNDCDGEFSIDLILARCPCGSANMKCIAGEELNIKEMEVE